MRPPVLYRFLAVLGALLLLAVACAPEEEAAEEGEPGADEAPDTEAEPGDEEAEPDAEEPAEADFEEQTIVVGLITAEDFPYQDGMERFKEVVEEETGGQVTVDVLAGAQLGDEIAILEQILDGSVQMGVGAGGLGTFADIINIGQLPFLIRGQDHLQDIYESEAGELLAERVAEQSDFHVLTFFTTGDSPIETVDTPIESVDDLQGVRIRVIENQALIESFEAMGANPTPIPFPEVYTALQQGVVEGAHLDWLALVTTGAVETVEYATTPDIPVLAEPRYVVVSQAWFDGLSPELQDVVERAADEARQRNMEVHLERQQETIAELEESMTFTDIDEDEFVEVMEPVWDETAQRLGAEDILNAILETRP